MTAAGTLPRVPGSPPASRVVDLSGLLRRPEASTANVAMEVWSDDAARPGPGPDRARGRGVTVAEVTTVDDVRAELDASPAAWSLALSVLVAAAAVLVAMLVMIVATATTWRARATDLAALRMAGLPGRSLRRLELLGQLPVVLVGALAGAVCGVIAAVVALPGVRQFTDPPDVDTTDFSTPWAVVVLGAVVGVLLLTALSPLAAGALDRAPGDPDPDPGGCADDHQSSSSSTPTASDPARGSPCCTRGLVHVYRGEGRDVAALAGVDLTVRAGEMIGLLGPSGAGKSTLLSLLAGLFRPTAGTVLVGDLDLTKARRASSTPCTPPTCR